MHKIMRKIIVKIVLVMAIMLVSSVPSWASHEDETLSVMIRRSIDNTSNLAEIVYFFSYCCGALFIALGLNKAKDHQVLGPQSVPLAEPIKFLLVGGMMIALPTISSVIQTSFGGIGDAQEINKLGWDTSVLTDDATNLTTILYNFMVNIYKPLQLLFVFFCYVAGAILMMVSLNRLTKTAQQGAQGPAGLGTIATFLLAGVLFSIPSSIGVLTETMFGNRSSMTTVHFMALSDSMDSVANAHAENVFVSILAFLVIVGIVSIIRGFFVLRGVAEGNSQMTMMSGISHIIAGAILVNFGEFANIIQYTLGIDSYGVLFNA